MTVPNPFFSLIGRIGAEADRTRVAMDAALIVVLARQIADEAPHCRDAALRIASLARRLHARSPTNARVAALLRERLLPDGADQAWISADRLEETIRAVGALADAAEG